MSALTRLLRRELDLAWSGGGGPALGAGFFVSVATLIPLALGPAPRVLAATAPGLAWIALALAALLPLDRLFARDLESGALDLLCLGPLPLEGVCAVKCVAQWLAAGLPLAILAPLGAIALGAPPSLSPMLVLVAALGGIAFAFVGGVGAALALASRRGGVLIAVVVLPLLTPPVIFGGAALARAAQGAPFAGALALLAAYALAAVALAPFAMAGACRNALS